MIQCGLSDEVRGINEAAIRIRGTLRRKFRKVLSRFKSDPVAQSLRERDAACFTHESIEDVVVIEERRETCEEKHAGAPSNESPSSQPSDAEGWAAQPSASQPSPSERWPAMPLSLRWFPAPPFHC